MKIRNKNILCQAFLNVFYIILSLILIFFVQLYTSTDFDIEACSTSDMVLVFISAFVSNFSWRIVERKKIKSGIIYIALYGTVFAFSLVLYGLSVEDPGSKFIQWWSILCFLFYLTDIWLIVYNLVRSKNHLKPKNEVKIKYLNINNGKIINLDENDYVGYKGREEQ